MFLNATPILSLLILAFTATTLAATSLPFSTSIYSWPLTSKAPTLLAQISYDPATLQTSLDTYNPPKPASSSSETDNKNDDLLRIGLYNKDSKEWTGTLTSLSSLPASSSDDPVNNSTLVLHLNPSNPTKVYHVDISPSSSTSSVENNDNNNVNDNPLHISLLRPTAGPTPQLSKPVAPKQAGGDGQGEEGEEEEKTLFQR